MNGLLDKLEKKIGKYAIKNLPLIMLICYALGYILQLVNPEIVTVISLNPKKILDGQVWRIISWLLIPPREDNLFFMLIMLYFYYSIGNMLTRTWGDFYFNYYIFFGIIFTIIGAFAFYGYSEIFKADFIEAFNAEAKAMGFGTDAYYTIRSLEFSTYYINMSIFLAFAATYPEMPILLFFILPVKVKALGVIYGIILVVEIINAWPDGLFIIGASLINFVVFYFTTRGVRYRKISKLANSYRTKMAKEENEQRKKRESLRAGIAKHKCAICGRTSETNPELEFRFCSKCQGNYEFCQDHLFTHTHFTE